MSPSAVGALESLYLPFYGQVPAAETGCEAYSARPFGLHTQQEAFVLLSPAREMLLDCTVPDLASVHTGNAFAVGLCSFSIFSEDKVAKHLSEQVQSQLTPKYRMTSVGDMPTELLASHQVLCLPVC